MRHRTDYPVPMCKHLLVPPLCGLSASLLLGGCVASVAARPLAQPAVTPATYTLASPDLELRLQTSPYSFQVVERRTGTVLLRQSRTSVAVDGQERVVSGAREVRQATDRLSASLVLPDTAESAGVEFVFSSPQVLTVTLTRGAQGAGEMGEAFQDQGEHVYGLWEYPAGGDLDNRGAEGALLSPGRKPAVSYAGARAPFYLTSRHYGVYVPTTAPARFRIAVEGSTGFQVPGSQLQYQVIYGQSHADVLARYQKLAGPALLPPTWALDSHWWRDDAHKGIHTGMTCAQDLVTDDAAQLQAHHIPASAIWLDRPYGTGKHGWGAFDFDAAYPDPVRMAADLDARGIRMMLWAANRYWEAQPLPPGRLLLPGSREPVLDLRKPEACRWLAEGLAKYARLGVRGHKIDRGDEGELPDALQNEMSVALARVAFESQAAVHPGDAFLLSRNAFDGARRYTAVWNGDSATNFAGLSTSIKNGLRCAAIGFPVWGSDTGGYLSRPGWGRDLFARWVQFSAYCPVMEVMIGPGRTPWTDFDPELLEITRSCAAAHHDLIPYVRSLLAGASRGGLPVMRPLFLVDPDARLADTWDEYLYGDGLLIAPVVAHDAVERSVTFPAGRWLDYNDRQAVYEGGRAVTVSAPLPRIPVFVREGAIIPRGDVLKSNNNWTANWAPRLRVEVFPGARADSHFDYTPGEEVPPAARTPRAISCAREANGFAVHCDDLGVSGEFEIACRGARSVTRNGRALVLGKDFTYDSKAAVLRVGLAGETTVRVTGARSVFEVTGQR